MLLGLSWLRCDRFPFLAVRLQKGFRLQRSQERLRCLFGPVLLTDLYCVVAHVFSLLPFGILWLRLGSC